MGENSTVIEPVSDDSKNQDFLAFQIADVSSKKKKELYRFQADNIVQMRNFMASLGVTGLGLFSQKSSNGAVHIEATQGIFDISHLPDGDVMYAPTQVQNGVISIFTKPVGTNVANYAEIIQQMPFEFYFSEGNCNTGSPVPKPKFPGSVLPGYNPEQPASKMPRRSHHDSFRHPYGPVLHYHRSIGYGPEVRLPKGVQEVCDPRNVRFFLDHNKQTVSLQPPRTPLPALPVVKRQNFLYGDQRLIPGLPKSTGNVAPIMEESAKRAHSKKTGFYLDAGGKHGGNGAPGVQGQQGAHGQHGISGTSGFLGIGAKRGGQDGYRGERGHPGTDGGWGVNGTTASDIVLTVSGSADRLDVKGTVQFSADLGGPTVEDIVFINCRGGNGGSGGIGGNGGTGGNGGNGGKGARGESGVNGGPGGDGGDGGNGGDGGQGGQGGTGGNAGPGGTCVIQTYDSKLLMLFEVDCMSGTPGKGARGGAGGAGGMGGNGGQGGDGGTGTGSTGVERRGNVEIRTHYIGHNGRDGCDGRPGRRGAKGDNGKPGNNGIQAKTGIVLWVTFKSNGEIQQESNARYDITINKLTIKSATIDDGVFEPNERIAVSGIVVRNTGGLSLPTGASVFFPSTESVSFEPTRYNIPELPPNKSGTIPVTFYGRIFDIPSPNTPGPFQSHVEFHPRAELLGRPFEKSFMHQKLTVQYPVRLSGLQSQESMGRGEVSLLAIKIENISRVAYGSCEGSGGTVVLQLHMDSRIIPVGRGPTSSAAYTVTYDPTIRDSMYIELHKIPPKDIVTIYIFAQMESRAELFDHCYWQADLYLRGKLIEYQFRDIRVSPTYIPCNPPADVLFVTSEAISRKEFVFWQRICQLLGVSVDFWDTSKQKGLSVDTETKACHKVSWQGRYLGKMILYPHCKLSMLFGSDIAHHFHGSSYQSGSTPEYSSSMVLFMPPSPVSTENLMLKHLSKANGSIEFKEYGGKHVGKPTSSDYEKWEEKQMKTLEKEVPSQTPVLLGRTVNIQSVKGLMKYSYGEVDIRRVPILRSSKFLVVDGAGGSVTGNMGFDDANLSPNSTDIPLASNFGQSFLATLYGLPMQCKLNLLKNTSKGDAPTSKVCFSLPNKAALSKEELVMITAAWEIADEVYGCSRSATRMKEFADDIQQNTSAYTDNGWVILRGLELIKKETSSRKDRFSNSDISQACSEIKRYGGDIQQALRRVRVDSKKLDPPLVSLEILLDRVHRCHQCLVKDEKWNLIN